MMTNNNNTVESDLPTNIGKPARRALVRDGYVRLEQLSNVSKTELLKLHGMGSNALGLIKIALVTKG